MKPLGVGLIGTGYMGKCHALAWNAVRQIFGDVPRPRLVHLAEMNSDLAARRASEFGFERSTANWRDLLADPDVDVISVTTPNQFHAEMATAALQAGKHVWCEKPMAPKLSDAERMLEAQKASGRIAIMGYNYIQNPVVRHIRTLIGEGAIGTVNHVRVEMDEDFMADPQALFYWKSEAASGYGALDDFAVHPLSLLWFLFGHVEAVIADMAKPYGERPLKEGGTRPVENHDITSVLMRMEGGVSAVLMANRSAWGLKGRIAIQIFGSAGSILYDQERMNEFELYQAEGRATEQGYRRILTAPAHSPYDRFIPAPGHGLGFNDLKIIECRELIRAIAGESFSAITFTDGLRIERTVHAMADSFHQRRWVGIGAA
ncbi:Gfo/Idh/MocA family oxidoreductase [Rhizobiaceae bacterium n13]|uniref:Gfo/Idh/MocA family oxidoreductase n=1 Tax=Ferirhizobium litorale TaxID=2927786 RepID=A0AAE3U0G7_9HYPH|nr:Gfo/Idh/MocA family oxidoreductase [Fererhizobium litorale]MDI7861194.1 Gfo/Idh/MocA family oxidoreductase [Fererhizobium litorale]MDI7921341.1 Gfo/Idh/MocA family oxidoreductase [Fererhizobium litorale]